VTGSDEIGRDYVAGKSALLTLLLLCNHSQLSQAFMLHGMTLLQSFNVLDAPKMCFIKNELSSILGSFYTLITGILEPNTSITFKMHSIVCGSFISSS
jgi:hypothetical protein